ncbi:MAG TPA: HAD family phosphatase [Aquabacterium sp.]|nr:HAD family phosphatase [Aquabacterium sp.]
MTTRREWPPTQAVVFDFGGVLFNWQPPRLIQAVLPHLAQDDAQALALAQQVFQSFVPGSDWSEFDRGMLDAKAVCARIAVRTGFAEADLQRLLSAIPPHLAPIQSTVAWVQELAEAGVRLHYLSNMPQPYKVFLQREHAFLRCFQSGLFSCDVHQVKPHAAVFRTAASRFGLHPSQMVFIDDSPHNIETARALGWRAVQFVDAAQCRAELAERGWLPG